MGEDPAEHKPVKNLARFRLSRSFALPFSIKSTSGIGRGALRLTHTVELLASVHKGFDQFSELGVAGRQFEGLIKLFLRVRVGQP